MSWLYSRALVEAYSEESFSDGEPSAPSNSTPTPQAFLWRDKTTDAWNRFPSGMTLQPLTENRGEDVLTSFLEAFPAKISARAEAVQASTEKEADSGARWRGSFVKYDPDTSTWRTHQCSLLGDFTEFSETWPKWGSMRSGACWEQTTLAPHISERESGLMLATPTTKANQMCPSMMKWPGRRAWWPTPASTDYKGSSKDGQRRGQLTDPAMGAIPAGGKLNPTWVAWLMGWPLGWTDLNASAMDKYQEWLQLHSDYLERGGRHDAGRIQYKRNTKRELHPNHAREAR